MATRLTNPSIRRPRKARALHVTDQWEAALAVLEADHVAYSMPTTVLILLACEIQPVPLELMVWLSELPRSIVHGILDELAGKPTPIDALMLLVDRPREKVDAVLDELAQSGTFFRYLKKQLS